MAWSQTAGWTSTANADFWIHGTTSAREIMFADGDNLSIPPLLGRVNMDLAVMSSQVSVLASVANPTTEELWVEKVIINIDTASSSSMCLSLGIATADSSSASNIADQTLSCSTAGLLMCNSSAALPVSWNSSSFFTVTAVTSSGIMIGAVGDVSVFYCVAVTT